MKIFKQIQSSFKNSLMMMIHNDYEKKVINLGSGAAHRTPV